MLLGTLAIIPSVVLAPLLQLTASPAVCTSVPFALTELWTISRKPPESVRLIDSFAITAAPQVEPPLEFKRIVWPTPKLAVGNCWVELETPEARGFVLLKLYSQYLLRSGIVVPELLISRTNSFPVILISANDRPVGVTSVGGDTARAFRGRKLKNVSNITMQYFFIDCHAKPASILKSIAGV